MRSAQMAGMGGGYIISHKTASKIRSEGLKEFTSEGKTYVVRTCNRCHGSGRYSFNLLHADRCYGCSGTGIVGFKGTAAQLEKREQQNTKARERNANKKREQRESAERERVAQEQRFVELFGALPQLRNAPKLMESRFDGSACTYCYGKIMMGDPIAYNGRALHVACFADMLLDDIDTARGITAQPAQPAQIVPADIELPF